jgi:hypothetical protein
MPNRGIIALSLVLAIRAGTTFGAEPPSNLVRDGGFETIREVTLADSRHIRDAMENHGADLSRDGPVVRMPVNFSMFCGTRRLRVVTGKPPAEVHGGAKAILLNGSYWMHTVTVHPGDVLEASFFAKGEGKARLILGYGNPMQQIVPNPVRVSGDRWTEIRHRFDLRKYTAIRSVSPRLATMGDIVIDDLSLVRVRSGDATEEQARIDVPLAFAVRTEAPVRIDGKLNESCWAEAVKIGPLYDIYHNEQYSEPHTFFRAAWDAEALYLAVEAEEPDPARMKAEKGAHDSWPGGNNIELFLDTNLDRKSVV